MEPINEMQMLKKLGEKYHNAPHADVIVLHINHCMENSYYFSEILGNVFGEVVFVAAPYNNKQMETEAHKYTFFTASICEQTYTIQKNNESLHMEQHSFLDCINTMIRVALEQEVFPKLVAGKRLLIIEDGGYHYDVMRALLQEYPHLQKQIVGVVEQTTSGTRRCYYDGMKHGFMYPCISIARSELKMNFESIFIGQRIVEELNCFLYAANTFLNYQKVIIVGYGVIGRSVRKKLEALNCQVVAIDTDDRIRRTAIDDGIQAKARIDREIFQKNTVLIGCVGNPAFTISDLKEFLMSDGETLYLASGSSKQVEFIDFIDLTRGNTCGEEVQVSLTCRARFYDIYDVTYQGITKQIVLIASGLPVNFYREDAVSLTYRVVDLVFVEMLMLGLNLVEETHPKELFLLGGDNPFKDMIDEKALIASWFAINAMQGQGDDLYKMLDAHPDADYLRGKFAEHEKSLYT